MAFDMSQAAAQFRDCEGGSTTMLDELKQALVENLTNRGVLGKLKAQVATSRSTSTTACVFVLSVGRVLSSTGRLPYDVTQVV